MKENIEVTTRKMYYYADIFVAVFVNLCFLIIYFTICLSYLILSTNITLWDCTADLTGIHVVLLYVSSTASSSMSIYLT